MHNKALPTNTMGAAEKWAARIDGPAYAIDNETAIKVTDGTVEVVSEGRWRFFPRSRPAARQPVSPGRRMGHAG